MTQKQARLDSVLDSLAVGVISLLPDGRIELQNAEASRILGVSSESSLGRTLAETLGPDHPVVRLASEALVEQRGVSSRACPILPWRGSRPVIVDLAAAPLGEEGDGTDGAVLTLHDRTIGQELEELVDQRARAELFGHLASGIAHELANPLSGIRGAAELLLGKLQEPALQRYPELIRAETDRMRRLLRDLGEFTQGGALRPRPVNVHRVLDDLVDLHGQSDAWQAIEVAREYDPSIPDLHVDPDRLAQVFLNLLRNAVQAMDGKGRLVLRTRVDTDYQLSSRARRLHMVRIDVEDSGPGIPEEVLPHVFTPFFTQRAEGSGLGLSVAQHWVVRHDGKIEVSSEPGQGTRVRVLLPLGSQA